MLHPCPTAAASIAYRMSFAEMVVPYRDPTPDHVRRTAYDIGEWGLGFMTTSLELGCDCLGEIRYLDAVVHDTAGEPSDDPQRGLHPRGGRRGPVEARRPADRAPRCGGRAGSSSPAHVTVANYEYLVYWRFYEDGNIECEVRATGIMVTTPFAGDEPPPYGTVVDTQTYAPIHQHFITARLDMDDRRDGQHRRHDRDRRSCRSARTTRTGSRSPSAPCRCTPSTRASRTSTGTPSGRGRSPTPTAATRSARRWPTSWCPAGRYRRCWTGRPRCFRRAQVLEHTLWVTPFAPDERWPCGRVRQPERGRRGSPGLDGGRPIDRRHRRRALVHLRHPPRAARRRVADHVGRRRVVLAQTRRLLRPQPGARRPTSLSLAPARHRPSSRGWRGSQAVPPAASLRRRARPDNASNTTRLARNDVMSAWSYGGETSTTSTPATGSS